MSKYRRSYRANFEAATAEPEVEEQDSQQNPQQGSQEEDYSDLSPEEEDEGVAILEQMILEGDEEGIEATLDAVEASLVEEIEAGYLSEAEAEELLAEQIEMLEALLDEAADLEEIPEEEYYDPEAEYYYDPEEGEYYYDPEEGEEEVEEDEEDEFAEQVGESYLEQMDEEQLTEVYEASADALEQDLDEVDELFAAGEIDEEEAAACYEEAAEIHDYLEQEFAYYLDLCLNGGVEEGEYENADAIDELAQEVQYQRRQNEQIQAEFAAAQHAQGVNDYLDQLEGVASDLVQAGIMPYRVFQEEFGEWNSERDRFAGFSQMCAANGTDANFELAQKERTLEMFQSMADSGTPLYTPEIYSNIAEFSDQELDELDSISVQSRRNVTLLLGLK